ncbi:MAG: hypothetical protein OEL87_00060 [Nanoarchaeota archaeon]|nr:hypothetical protein [Nanoarchaeota archaeon]
MTYKRLELRKGNFIVLTNQDKLIINSIMYYLKINHTAKITDIYKQVKKDVKPTLSNDKIKYILMVLYIKQKIMINNYIKSHQTQFRTWIKLAKGERLN